MDREAAGVPRRFRTIQDRPKDWPGPAVVGLGRTRLRRGKTDQEGLGRKVAIPRGEIACPVAALRTWLDAAGQLFQSSRPFLSGYPKEAARGRAHRMIG